MILSPSKWGQYFPSGWRLVPLLASVISLSGVIGVMAAQQPLLLIGLMLTICLGLAFIRWSNMATLAVIFILYTNAAVVAVQFHGVPFIIGAGVPALLIIPLANYLVFRREKIIITPVLPLVVFFLVVQMTGIIFAKEINPAMEELITFVIEGLGIYFVITNTVRTSETLRLVIWVLLGAGLFMGSLSFYQQVTQTLDNNYGGFAQVSDAAFGTGEENLQGETQQWRLAGPLGQQNRYAQIMAMLMPLGLFRIWSERSLWLRLLAAIATAFIAVGAVLTFSRGAAVGMVMTMVIMALMRYFKLYQLALVGLGLLLLMQAFPQYGVRLISLESVFGVVTGEGAGIHSTDGSTQSRVTEMMAAALIFADHPVIGVGPGMYRFYYQDYARQVGIKSKLSDREAHNLYLGIGAENGLLGLACFALIVGITLAQLARTRKVWQQRWPEFANGATGFMLAIITYLTTGLFLHFAFIRYFWLIMALASAASYISETRLAREEPVPAKLIPSRS